MIVSICDPDQISYVVAADESVITFYPCGRSSHHPRDIAERYCPVCDRFMGLVEACRELKRERF